MKQICVDRVSPDRIRIGRRMPWTRTLTICSRYWSLATAAWARHRSFFVMPTIRLPQPSWALWALTSKSRLSSDKTSVSSFRFGYVLQFELSQISDCWCCRTRRDKNDIEPSLLLTTAELWALFSCTMSPMKNHSIVSRTGNTCPHSFACLQRLKRFMFQGNSDQNILVGQCPGHTGGQ